MFLALTSWHGAQSSSSAPQTPVYFTAWDGHRALMTVPDVYGIDRRHLAAATGQ